MAVKVEVKGAKAGPEYPKLMKSKTTDLVVLFTTSGEGTVIRSCGSRHNPLGKHTEGWGPSYFEDFHGSITLSNG